MLKLQTKLADPRQMALYPLLNRAYMRRANMAAPTQIRLHGEEPGTNELQYGCLSKTLSQVVVKPHNLHTVVLAS